MKLAAQNKSAQFEYFIEEVIEAGIVLTGSEVKSVRNGLISITESFAGAMANDATAIYLFNAQIQNYENARDLKYEPKRPRKLLLKKRQNRKLLGQVARKGYSLVPLKVYFNERGILRLSLAVGKGKKWHDKRATIKEREWQRSKARRAFE